LVTGGCGFIGVNLVRNLLEGNKDCRIRVLDNLIVGRREDLAEVSQFNEVGEKDLGEASPSRLELVVGDIRNQELAEKACKGFDVIIHLAASTGVNPSIEDPRDDCTINVIGTFNYLEAARVNGIKRFVFASSGAPLGEQVPPIHEEMVPKPISPYGASKLCGEAYCSAFYGSYGLETVALRFGNVYGPYSSHKGSVVAKFIKHIIAREPMPIYGDGNQTRDFIYIEDLVEAILSAIEKPGVGGQLFQIATHQEHTVEEVAQILNSLARKHLGRVSPIVHEKERKGEVKRNFSEIGKARRMLGIEPKHDLKTGLEKTFLWFLERSEKDRLSQRTQGSQRKTVHDLMSS
jgi:UDP-glucose 4-epimerase